MEQWRDSIAVYFRPHVLLVLVLGFSSGLPLALSFATLSAWLTEVDVSKTSIGLFALVGTPYTLKFLWAPLLDQVRLPVLTRLLGKRRGWILFTQFLLLAAIIALGQTNPAIDPLFTAAMALTVAFCSASQDIVIDAFRVEALEENEQGAGSAMLVYGYRIGMLVSGAGALYLADSLSWPLVYAIMASFVLIGSVAVLLAKEPPHPSDIPQEGHSTEFVAWLQRAVVEPFREFLGRSGWALVLLFILLYKLGDAVAGTMTIPFYLDLGFNKTEIAEITKVFGLAATLFGSFVGGLLVARLSILKALLVAGILQAASNLMFAAQAMVGADPVFLMATVAIENVSGGMGTTAFVAYLAGLCNLAFTATQYALLSSFMAFGRTFFASSGGWFADQLGWVEFFLLSTVIAVPGVLMILFLARHPELNGRPQTGRSQTASNAIE